MTRHAEDALGSAGIAQVLNLPLAVATAETASTKGLVSGQNSQVFNLVTARIAAIGAVVTDQGAVTEQEQVRIGVEEGAAGIAAETVNVPTIPGWRIEVRMEGWR